MPVASSHPVLDLPETNVFSFLFDRKDRPFPDDQVIFRDGNDASRAYSYSDIRQASIEFGKGLKSVYDLKKGDVVGVYAANDIDFPPVVFGTLWAGGVISPANPGYTVPELTFQLKDSGAKLVITQQHLLSKVQEACQSLQIPSSNIILMGSARDSSNRFKHWSSVRNTEGTRRFRTPKISPKTDLAFLVYSSGTTGRPKGVEITHHNMTSNICQIMICESYALSFKGSTKIKGIPESPPEGDKLLSCLPFFHIYGLTLMVLTPLRTGVLNVVMSQFEIEKWCSLVQEHKVTFAYIVPPIAVLLSKHPVVAKYDLSSIRMLNSGAAPLTKELVEALFKRKGLRLKQAYGLSETSPTAFSQSWEDWFDGVGSVGYLVSNMEAKFCVVPGSEGYSEEAAKEVATGEVGELYLRGPNVFKGYHNNEQATRESLDKDRWYRTGDVGYLDQKGRLFITDRVKELIKYKGFQVPPAELEGYLVDHDLVDDVAVVGVNSEELGTEVPRAYIVRKGGAKALQEGDDKTIMDWLAGRVANHKKLRGGIRFVDSIPKSASGKILRRVLKDEVKKELEDQKKGVKVKAKL